MSKYSSESGASFEEMSWCVGVVEDGMDDTQGGVALGEWFGFHRRGVYFLRDGCTACMDGLT